MSDFAYAYLVDDTVGPSDYRRIIGVAVGFFDEMDRSEVDAVISIGAAKRLVKQLQKVIEEWG